MIYVPILKTRGEELRVVKGSKKCFSEKIIPLIEVISETYQIRYEQNADGEYIIQKHGRRMMKVKAKPTEKDVITLDYINDLIDNNLVFIDYFRFSLDKYGRNIDLKSAELSYNLNNDYNLYKGKVMSVTLHDNMIPVVSVKKGFDIPKSELMNFLNGLQKNAKHVALRITEEWIEPYKIIIENVLREEDYLLFDVEEQNPELKFMEIEQIQEYNSKCKVILINSPRKLDVKNGEYPERGKTDLINNCAPITARTYDLDGYGDYCGLKDTMPLNNGSNGTGAALALLYDYKENVFYSYCNHDTRLGVRGYRQLLPIIKSDEGLRNVDGDCPGYDKIHSLNGCGNWNTWHHINAIRYIYQVYKNI